MADSTQKWGITAIAGKFIVDGLEAYKKQNKEYYQKTSISFLVAGIV